MIIQINDVNIAGKKAKNGNDYWIVDTSGGKMTCWDKEVSAGLVVFKGKSVDAEIVQKGEFKTIKSFQATDEKPSVVAKSVASDPMREQRIVRMNVLNRAVDCFSNGIYTFTEDTSKLTQIFALAYEFECWVNEDR